MVLFLSNPFHAEPTARLIAHIEAALAASPDLKVFVISYSPTQAALFDASPVFRRHYADHLAFSEEEAACSPYGNTADSVVIWQSLGGEMTPPLPGADRPVRIKAANIVAEVESWQMLPD